MNAHPALPRAVKTTTIIGKRYSHEPMSAQYGPFFLDLPVAHRSAEIEIRTGILDDLPLLIARFTAARTTALSAISNVKSQLELAPPA
jgi:hypothetical protein